MTKHKPVNNIKRLGISLVNGCVPYEEIDRVVEPERREEFNDLFGIQTCSIDGMYQHDVEAVLQRMYSNKLTGSQLIWD